MFNFLLQAQTELGVLYTEDERKDLERAAGLFKLAADQKVLSQIYLHVIFTIKLHSLATY